MSEPKDLAALRRAFRAPQPATPPRRDADSSHLPTADQIWNTAAGAADDETSSRVLEQLAQHPHLLEEWDLAVALQEEAATPSAAAKPPAAEERTSWVWEQRTWLAAAAVFLLVTVGVVATLRQPQEAPVYRAGSEPTQIEVVAPQEGRCATRSDCTLRWRGAAGGTWSLVVYDEELLPLFREDGLVTPQITLPQRLMEQPALYLWQATHFDERGIPTDGPTFELAIVN